MAKQTRRHKAKRKRPATAAVLEEQRAHRWLHDKDVPIRQIARGVLGDVRVLGDRADELPLRAAEELLVAFVTESLRSKSPKQRFRGARLLTRLRDQRNALRFKEFELVQAAMEAHLAEVVARWQATVDAQGAQPTLDDLNREAERGTRGVED
jgi:hypothetical protein